MKTPSQLSVTKTTALCNINKHTHTNLDKRRHLVVLETNCKAESKVTIITTATVILITVGEGERGDNMHALS